MQRVRKEFWFWITSMFVCLFVLRVLFPWQDIIKGSYSSITSVAIYWLIASFSNLVATGHLYFPACKTMLCYSPPQAWSTGRRSTRGATRGSGRTATPPWGRFLMRFARRGTLHSASKISSKETYFLAAYAAQWIEFSQREWVGEWVTLSSVSSCMPLCDPVCTLTYLNNIFTIFAQYLHNICTIFAQYLPNICPIFAQYLYNICTIFAHLLLDICTKFIKYLRNKGME